MSPTERIIITIKKDGKMYLDKTAVNMKTLIAKLSKRSNKEVFLKADKSVPYGAVVTVMGELREIGIERLGMVTEPKARVK
jgi:biopolymer transport protein TolR